MILSFHIADVGVRRALQALRVRPKRASSPGLRYAETFIAFPLRSGALVLPYTGRVALVAAWDDDNALERFVAAHPLGSLLGAGWLVRLQPLRSWGAWSALPGLPRSEPSSESEPVAVLTLGRLRVPRVWSFLSTSAKAEHEAVSHPALLAGTSLARPPGLVATFSLWRTSREMRAYAVGHQPGGHLRAIDAHRSRPFHHEAVFVRLRPYGARGLWDGRQPLSENDRAQHAAAAGLAAP